MKKKIKNDKKNKYFTLKTKEEICDIIFENTKTVINKYYNKKEAIDLLDRIGKKFLFNATIEKIYFDKEEENE